MELLIFSYTSITSLSVPRRTGHSVRLFTCDFLANVFAVALWIINTLTEGRYGVKGQHFATYFYMILGGLLREYVFYRQSTHD